MSNALNILAGMLAAAVLSACSWGQPQTARVTGATPPPPAKRAAARPAKAWSPSGSFRNHARDLDEAIKEWVAQHGVVAEDGTAYAADVVPLMLYAARTRNEALYAQAYKGAQRLILMEKSDPYVQGFVLIRRVGNGRPETAGATETLEMARALWEASENLGRAADRELALQVLEGYAKFAYEMNGVWLVRKQFDFATRSFAGSSLLSNYDGDFLDTVTRKAPRTALSGFSKRAYALLTRSVTPSGLLYPLVQPEIGATYPGLDADVYGPNGIVALEESCHGAVGATRGQPEVARGVFEFVRTRPGYPDKLHAYFIADDGSRTADERLSDTGYACIARLALALGDADGMKQLEDALIDAMDRATDDYDERPGMLGSSTTVLLAAQAAGAIQ